MYFCPTAHTFYKLKQLASVFFHICTEKNVATVTVLFFRFKETVFLLENKLNQLSVLNKRLIDPRRLPEPKGHT